MTFTIDVYIPKFADGNDPDLVIRGMDFRKYLMKSYQENLEWHEEQIRNKSLGSFYSSDWGLYQRIIHSIQSRYDCVVNFRFHCFMNSKWELDENFVKFKTPEEKMRFILTET